MLVTLENFNIKLLEEPYLSNAIALLRSNQSINVELAKTILNSKYKKEVDLKCIGFICDVLRRMGSETLSLIIDKIPDTVLNTQLTHVSNNWYSVINDIQEEVPCILSNCSPIAFIFSSVSSKYQITLSLTFELVTKSHLNDTKLIVNKSIDKGLELNSLVNETIPNLLNQLEYNTANCTINLIYLISEVKSENLTNFVKAMYLLTSLLNQVIRIVASKDDIHLNISEIPF